MALPSGFTQLEYIESSGTQCMDLGFVGKTGMKFVGKFMALSSSDLSDSDLVLGALGPSALRYYPLAFDAGKFGYGYRSFYTSTTTAAINKEYEFEVEFLSGAQKLTINGSVVKSGSNTSDITTSTYNLYLFGANNANSPMGLGSYRMWPLKTYYNGALYADIIPCINASGVVGMWDDVNGAFRGNIGSGSFKAGPVVVTGPQGSRTLLDAVDYQITTGNVMINAATYMVTQGKVMIDGSICTINLKKKEQPEEPDETILISFKVPAYRGVEYYTYTAEEGMTWREFVGSKYDTSGGKFAIDNNRVKYESVLILYREDRNYEVVYSNDKIIGGYKYTGE